MAKNKKKPFPIVEVRWGDAWVDTGDISVKKAQKLGPIERTTVGRLIANNDDGLVIVTDTYDDDPKTVNTHMFIPHGMVIEWWEH